MRRTRWLVLVALSAWACGSRTDALGSADDDPGDDSGGAGAGPGGGSGGAAVRGDGGRSSGGASTSRGGAASGGRQSPPPPQGGGAGPGGATSAGGRPTCDPGRCPPFSNPDLPIRLTTCCTAEDRCGFDLSSLGASPITIAPACQDPFVPSWPDPACRTRTSNLELTGCCTVDGRCGLDVVNVGLGCVSTSLHAGIACDPRGGVGAAGSR